jgi:hypothetical protein
LPPKGRTRDEVDAARSAARIDATRARHQCCATHQRHTTHEDLNSATLNVRIHALSSAVLTLTVRAFEE